MSAANHSPLPWNVEQPYGEPGLYIAAADTSIVCRLFENNLRLSVADLRYGNGELIARAVNSHADLLAALKGLVANQEEGWRKLGTMPEEHIQQMPYLRAARAAITKAEGNR